MKQKVILALKKATKLPEKEISDLLEIPPSQDLGDFAFPCFVLSKKEKKSPVEISSQIAPQIKSKNFEKVESKGPYVNFFLNRSELAKSVLSAILKEKEKYGSNKKQFETVMVEFSQANTHKAFHVGHIRGTSLGESLSRILEFKGSKVLRANYQGDSGMHVAKWIWCYSKFHSKEKLQGNEAWIASIYVDAVKRLSEDPDLQKEVDKINLKLESKEDKKLNDLWKKTRKLSLDSLEQIYSDLNTHFDKYFFESEVEEPGKKISQDLLKKGLAKISEKATIIDLEKYNLGIWVLLRSDGTVLYSAKDLALAEEKFKKYKVDKSIYVVGSAQKHHIFQLFKTLELMKFKQAKKLEYVPVTEVRLPTGKMSSRTGENILYSDFKKDIVKHTISEIKKRDKLSNKELERRALAISISAIKYSMLKQDTNKLIVFDKQESLRFEGNTGPYLLYSYARARSILGKSKIKKLATPGEVSDLEKSLIFTMSQFSEIVDSAAKDLAPNLIANYAFDLAQKFNEFYHSEKVLGSQSEAFKLALVESFSIVLKSALNLLGIEVLEKM